MEEGTKLDNWNNSMLSTPSIDVEEYSKLRRGPYPQQSVTNLPYYFLEPEHPGPRITSSDLQVFPLEKLGERDADKLKRLYVCLKEECGFKKYLLEEKRIGMSSVESNRVYTREISGSDFRILNIKDDIAQFTRYLDKAYNLKSEKFNSVVEAGLAAALGSCSVLRCFGIACKAISTGANFYLWVWLFILEMVVVRMITFLQLTMANYANGTGLTTWSFCPYIKGLGISLVMVELIGGLSTFWEAPLSLIKAWVSVSVENFYNCTPTAKIEDNFIYKNDLDVIESRCFSEPDEFTAAVSCPPDTSNSEKIHVFNSNYFFYFAKELTNMNPMYLTLNNGLLYLITVLLWFIMTQTTRNGFDKLVQRMHRGPLLLLGFLIICFMMAVTLENDIAKEGTYAFFSLKSNFLHIDVIMAAMMSALSQVMVYYLEIGSKMPYRWDPDGVFSWKASVHLSIYFFSMWISYLAIYNEKHFYKMNDISCISSEIYLLNSALPRFFNSLFFLRYIGVIYFLLHAYTHYLISTTLVTIVWRNLSHNVQLLKTYPKIQYIYDFICLLVIILTMISIRDYKDYWIMLHEMKYIESACVMVLTMCFVVAVLTYYGPSRVWVDLQFLTRRRIHPSIHLNFIVFLVVISCLAVLGIPKVLEKFMQQITLIQVLLIVLVVTPFIFTLSVFLASGEPISEVRQFHYWGERSERQQSERLRFNPAQFKTSRLRYKEIDFHESGDDFYRDQRKKALVRIAFILKASEE